MPARILLIVLMVMVVSILSIVVLQQTSGSGSNTQPPEGELLSTPSKMAHEL
ncbi:hypothetical protein OCK02_03950 (plasmid) [Rhizobium sp. TRM96647]|uniref:hypothetical protein n=1 Tax=unclassified Rhizobium TaxID=2613769 RepID=UPI0021E8195A|nr:MULTISPECIES: hypothetical protein [unclassified Rhizobium]MCV3735348.1 hypothetical protein [Rhizobium sp. TRM96647]MCV3757889.1 hypothetical protein [Rhizobium sp. TRM96650]